MADTLQTLPEKYALDNARDEAQARMAALSAMYDGTTERHLRRIGITSGWRCLEIGAGSPTIPTWMAEQAGPGGSILVTDINTRFLNTLVHPLITVTQHDIGNDPLPENHFDLVHARLVFSWVRERDRALPRVVQALKPGGWLVIEDFDPLSLSRDQTVDTPELVVRVYRAMQQAILSTTGADIRFVRRLPRLFRDSGLTDVGSEGRVLQWEGGSAGMDLVWSNCMQLRPAVIASGAITDQEFDTGLELMKSPEAAVTSPVMWSAWGRRPELS
ncbi:MAG: methyltransferase domain-containing protein [Chloroflexi bacterium]|nr:methyltransferase domain-containing protein [Chloroflexota bacterium]